MLLLLLAVGVTVVAVAVVVTVLMLLIEKCESYLFCATSPTWLFRRFLRSERFRFICYSKTCSAKEFFNLFAIIVYGLINLNFSRQLKISKLDLISMWGRFILFSQQH